MSFTWIVQVPQDWPNLASSIVTAMSTASTQVEVISPATFHALVFNDIDQNGSQSEGEAGIRNIEFTLQSSNGKMITNTTDFDGRSNLQQPGTR